jgi:hypothetical protein
LKKLAAVLGVEMVEVAAAVDASNETSSKK